jgi:hypothetical protein
MVAAADDAQKAAATAASKKKNAKDQAPTNPDDDLSDEDLALKRELEELVAAARAETAAPAAVLTAASTLGERIRTATASMTSVPKPLKFLRPHAADLKARWASLPATAATAEARRALADVVSVLASTGAPRGAPGGARRAARLRECLRFKVAGNRDDVGPWGHEYLRHLAGEIAAEHAALHERDEARAAAGGGAPSAAALKAAAAEEEAEAAAADEADLDRFEAGLEDQDDDAAKADKDKAGGDKSKAAADDAKPAAAAPEGGGAGAAKDDDAKKGEGDKKKKKGDAGEAEREKMTPEARAAWLAQQRAIRAALPPVTTADIMALVEQVRSYVFFSPRERARGRSIPGGGAPFLFPSSGPVFCPLFCFLLASFAHITPPISPPLSHTHTLNNNKQQTNKQKKTDRALPHAPQCRARGRRPAARGRAPRPAPAPGGRQVVRAHVPVPRVVRPLPGGAGRPRGARGG